ncbi:hypothetical protein NEN81_02810 [Enterobacter asburiae]|uniref:hypothetical protein n=1 Tax=Enterobacter asburiae TaxID=61645 RepID=UPI002DBA874A|nr:hypothetical protein [Enterobacter asburiae]MEB7277282.1 hypothetical protein [Enterobacter asburiae]
MSVKRYEWMACDEHACHCDVVESAEGDMVDYDDYAALEARCAALAAELSAFERICNEAVFITDEHYEQCPPEVQKMIRSLVVLKIPSYQAFMAEVRAQGVDVAIEHLLNKFEGTGRIGVPVMALEWLAKELRKGVQS